MLRLPPPVQITCYNLTMITCMDHLASPCTTVPPEDGVLCTTTPGLPHQVVVAPAAGRNPPHVAGVERVLVLSGALEAHPRTRAKRAEAHGVVDVPACGGRWGVGARLEEGGRGSATLVLVGAFFCEEGVEW